VGCYSRWPAIDANARIVIAMFGRQVQTCCCYQKIRKHCSLEMKNINVEIDLNFNALS